MFSSYFASITEHSFLCICKVFISKEFVRFSYGLGRFYASKRIIQSKDFDANVHAHSVSSAVQCVQYPFGRRWIMCNPFQGSNSLRGANNLFREIENSINSFCCILCLRFRLELCFQYFTYRTLLHCFQFKVVVHVVRLYNLLFVLE